MKITLAAAIVVAGMAYSPNLPPLQLGSPVFWFEPNQPGGPLSDFDQVFTVPNTQWPVSAASTGFMLLQQSMLQSKGAAWISSTLNPFLAANPAIVPVLDTGNATGASCNTGGQFTISGIVSNVMTVTAVTGDGAAIAIGQTLWINGVSTGRNITSLGTGTGTTGTYNVTAGANVGAGDISAWAAPSTSATNTTVLNNNINNITRIQATGAPVQWVSIQSLYSKQPTAPPPSTNPACTGYGLGQRIADHAWFVNGVRASFPSMKFIINDATLAKSTGTNWINNKYPLGCGGVNCTDVRTEWAYIISQLAIAGVKPEAYSADQGIENYRNTFNTTFPACITPDDLDVTVYCGPTLDDTSRWLGWLQTTQNIRPMLEITSLSATTNAQWNTNVVALSTNIAAYGNSFLGRDFIVLAFRCATTPCASNPIPNITLPEGTAATFTNDLGAVQTQLLNAGMH